MSETTGAESQINQSRLPFSGGRLFYGWIQVIALSWTELISWGIVYYAFSVLIVPMGRDLGWSRVEMTGAFSTGILVSGISGIPIGRWVDRHGARGVMTSGSIASSLLLVAWARVNDLTGFYLIWIGLGVAMAAILYEPSFVVVATWFQRHRPRALALLTFVGGLASVVFLPLTNWLTENWGWRDALLILSAVLAITTIAPHWFFLRHRPGDYGLFPDGEHPGDHRAEHAAESSDEHLPSPAARSIGLRDALHWSSFWWIAVSFAVIWGCGVAVQIHLIPYLQDRGFSPAFAATAAGAIGLLKLPGRLIFAPLSERIPYRYVAISIFMLHALAILMLALSDSTVAVILFVGLFSAGNGALTIMRATIVANVFGLSAYGGISGMIGFMSQAAVAVGPLGVSLLVVVWGGYQPVFWLLTGLIALSAAGIFRVKETVPKALARQT